MIIISWEIYNSETSLLQDKRVFGNIMTNIQKYSIYTLHLLYSFMYTFLGILHI